MSEPKSRRRFLAGTAAGIGAAVPLAGCGSQTPKTVMPETNSKAPRALLDDPLSPVRLPMPDKVFQPPQDYPILRTGWQPRNVIVIVLDSFRADHLGALGNPQARTPNLDKFAAGATIFTHSYPEGLPTIPMRTSLHTGRFTYPFRGWQVLYPEDQPLLAEILWSQGFRSCLVSDTYHLHKPSYGFCRGFDEVAWIRGQEGDPYVRDPAIRVDLENYFKPRTGSPAEREQTRQYLLNRHDWKSEDDYFTPRVMDRALAWLKRQKRRENLFLYIDSFSPHEPWDPPDRYLKMVAPDFQGKRLVLPVPGDVEGYLTPGELNGIRSLYRGSVAFVDACVGHLLDEVARMGMFENSLIAILTDHGEPFGDHGVIRKARPWPYEELARTMLMIRHPGGKAVKRVDSYTQQTDLTATVLEFLRIPTLKGMTSRSLLPVLLGQQEKVRDFAVCCHHMGGLSIRHEGWSYHYYLPGAARSVKNSKLRKDEPELYNLHVDPTEKKSLYRAEPERARQLHDMLQAFTRELIQKQIV